MADRTPGVVLVGFVRSESGFGEVPRSLVPAFRELHEPLAVVERRESDPARRQEHPFSLDAEAGDGSNGSVRDVAVVFENADSMPSSFESGELDVIGGALRVGYWCWEVDRFPEALGGAGGLVDEVWTLSEHAARAIGPMVDVPVVAVPPVVPVRTDPPPARATLDLPDDAFVVLFTYDARGGTIRKNPEGAIDAYTRAFAPDDGCLLVLKSINASSQPGLLERLRSHAGDRPDIEIRDGYLTATEQAGLVVSCDVYLSLHRAEGFGLTMAEAMAAGRAVVATGWSGNLDFMDATTARLVGYDLEPVPADAFPWPTGGAQWATPDVDDAAVALRSLRDDPEAARALGGRARASIAERHSAAARSRVIGTRLARLRRTRSLPRRAVRKLRRALQR